jgi:Protein of unknown function (DUF3429)
MITTVDQTPSPQPLSPDVPAPSAMALVLGYGGLLPFVVVSLAVVMQPAMAHGPSQSLLLNALSAYGALIASFLGGMHWGIAARTSVAVARFHHVWGVVPSLLAWVAMLLPDGWRLVALAATLALCLAVDLVTYPRVGWATWLRLRWHLTLVAMASCLLAGMVTFSRHA